MSKIWAPGQKKETPEEKAARMLHNAQMLALPYEAKVALAESRVRDWQTTCAQYGKNYAVSVGGAGQHHAVGILPGCA